MKLMLEGIMNMEKAKGSLNMGVLFLFCLMISNVVPTVAGTRCSDGYSLSSGSLVKTSKSNDIYVLGSRQNHNNGWDYLVTKYDKAGTRLWERVWSGPAGEDDYSSAITVDNSGNVCVTGVTQVRKEAEIYDYGYATVKYSTDGRQLWAVHYEKPGAMLLAPLITSDGSGNIYVAGSSGVDKPGKKSIRQDEKNWFFTTIKYNAKGKKIWDVRYAEKGYVWISPVDIEVDGEGCVCVTGYSTRKQGDERFVTVKYEPNGKQLWVARYIGNGDIWTNRSSAMALDSAGNIYVVGETHIFDESPEDSNDTVFSFDDNDIEQADDLFDIPTKFNGQFVTIKYDTNGTEQWVANHQVPNGWRVYPIGVVLDKEDGIYIAGCIELPGKPLGYDDIPVPLKCKFVTIKYDANGKESWLREYDVKDKHRALVGDLIVDEHSNIYVKGAIENENGQWIGVMIKYGTKGDKKWIKRFQHVWETVKTLSAP